MRSPVLGVLLLGAASVPGTLPAAAQDTLRLGALQEEAVRGDPRVRQVELEEAASELRIRNIAVERLPELTLTGEAIRQSEVAAIPIRLPGVDIPTPPKERYEVALNADWLVYDGGVLAARRDVARAELAAARAELAAELYPLRMEVLERFFDALLLQERVREVSTLVEDLDARLAEVREQVGAGAALPGDTATIRAEMLRAIQQRDEVAASLQAALSVLERLTGRVISGQDVLALPDLGDPVARVRTAGERRSPEAGDSAAPRVHPRYAAFDARRERLEREAAVIRARARPRLSALGEYAYGRPGLRQFTEELHDYWVAGLHFRWVPWDWGATGRDVASVRIGREIVDTEEAAFTERLLREVERPVQAMQRLQAALDTDAEIIALREQVERQARAQLAERAITAATYVDARTDLQEARIAFVRHQAELARAQARYLTTLGVEIR